MNQHRHDLWTLGSDPCSITSFLTLTFVNGYLEDRETPIHTKNCGLGWRFRLSIASDNNALKAPTLTISLVPYLVTLASIPTLQASFKHSKNLEQQDLHNHRIKLSTQSQCVPLASFVTKESFTGEATIDITLSFPTSFSLSLASGSPRTKVQKALSSQLGGELCDTKFCLFTRRSLESDAVGAQMIFAESALLQNHCSNLDDILNGKTDYKTVTGYNIPNRAQNYEYDSDSDLDSDSDSAGGGTRSPSITASASARETLRLRGDERAIVIDDIAFQTWKAFMVYIYTKEISFRPLTSNQTQTTSIPPASEEPVVACSPKSMYRLANKIGSQELQTLALNAINEGLVQDNIVEKLFCRFTSNNPEVQRIEVDYFIKNLTPGLFETFAKKLMSVVAGQLPYSYDVLVAIMLKMQRNDIESELYPEAPPDPTSPPTPAGWLSPAQVPSPQCTPIMSASNDMESSVFATENQPAPFFGSPSVSVFERLLAKEPAFSPWGAPTRGGKKYTRGHK